MNLPLPRRSRRLGARLLVGLLAIGVGIAALSGCAPKITNVDAKYTMPEGAISPQAQLIVWADQPTTAYYYSDAAPADPGPGDSLVEVVNFERYSPGAIQGMILDGTSADAFQTFRRENGGGVRQFSNVTAQRTRQWLQSHEEAYHFVDPAPSGYQPRTYIGRGLVAGVANQTSPLTNLGQLAGGQLANVNLRAVWWANTKADKGPVFGVPKIKLQWDPVPGAVQYLVDVYDFRSDIRSLEERILSGTPAPFYDGQATEYFIGLVPASVNFMFVGDSSAAAAPVTVFATRPIVPKAPVLVRVSAFDASGEMIGISAGHADPQAAYIGDPTIQSNNHGSEVGIQRGVRGNNTYVLYRLNATTAVDTVPAGGGGGGGGGG